MIRDYKVVAQQAKAWTHSGLLSPNMQAVALQLSELAEILTDAYYGCPTEHFAAEEMYGFLSRCVTREQSERYRCNSL